MYRYFKGIVVLFWLWAVTFTAFCNASLLPDRVNNPDISASGNQTLWIFKKEVINIAASVTPPHISYTTPNTYQINAPIPTLKPTNSGGAVPATIYGQVTTFAGNGVPGNMDGTGTAASFNDPTRVALDAAGNLYVADRDNNLIRKITPAGVVTTFASGFNQPNGVVVGIDGNIYVADAASNQIKKITPGGAVSVFAGSGSQGSANGQATSATFYYPYAVVQDAAGNMYVADSQNNLIRKITPAGNVSTLAGRGNAGFSDGVGTGASFYNPSSVATDAAGNVYVADPYNYRVRKITPAGVVTTIAGNSNSGSDNGAALSATFNVPAGVAVDAAGNVYVADITNNLIRKIDPLGIVTTLAGSGNAGATDGVGSLATFNRPNDVQVNPAGFLYITDYGNSLIRKVIVTGYTIDKPLPAGLSFDARTGFVSGTPTEVWPATDYIITAYNTGGSSSFTVNIKVTNTSALITGGAVTGSINACVGTASSNYQQFTVSGTNLLNNITVTAPSGFQVSTAPGNGYSNSLTLTQTGGKVNNITVYVRLAPFASVGNHSDAVSLTSAPATTIYQPVSGTINAPPTVNQVANQVLCKGSVSNLIKFTGTGLTYNWTNDNPSIGLAASGSGNIASFTAVNNTGTPVTANITVTPIASQGLSYVNDLNERSILEIDNSSFQVVARIPAGNYPPNLTVSPDGSRIYVANSTTDNKITVIDAVSRSIITTINIGSSINGMAVSPDGSKLFITTWLDNAALAVINTATNQVTATLPIGGNPTGVVISSDGSKVYVASYITNTVTVVNTTSNTIISTIPVGKNPGNLAISPDGTRIYVPSGEDNKVSVINTTNNTVIANIALAGNPNATAVSPDGSKLYVSNESGGTVTVINTANNSILNTIPGFNQPNAMALSKDGTHLYVIGFNAGKSFLGVVNTLTNTIENIISSSVGVTNFSYFLSPGGGCAGTPITFSITVNTSIAPSVAITQSALVCPGQPVSFTAIAANAGNAPTYQWQVNGINAGTNSPAFNSNTLNENDAITCIITGNGSCTVPTTSNTVNVLFKPTVTPSVSITPLVIDDCDGMESTFTATPVNGGTNPVYQWQVNGINAGTNNSVFASRTLVNNDVVVCKLTNTTDCTITPTVTSNAVSVIKSQMVSPSVSITTSALATGTICEGSPVTFSATVVNGDLSNTVYQWKVNGINTGTSSSLFTTNDYNNGDLVTCSIITSGKCLITTTANSNQIALSVIPNVTPTVSIAPSSVYPACLNAPVTFAAGSPNAGVNPNYQWQVNGNTAGTNSSTFTSSTLANGDEITCIISNPASCIIPVTSNMITFSSLPLPTIVFNSSPVTVKLGESVILNPVITGNIATYSWSPALGLSDINAEHPVAKPSVTTTYTLLVTSASGCTATASVTINVINPVIIPSTFTPNGDGVNDIWSIPSLVGYPGCTVNVFNRYGTQLFKSVGYAMAWDGTYKNSPLPAGTYYYIVDPKNGLPKISGYVVILR